MVEGFDAGSILKPEEAFGDSDIIDFTISLIQDAGNNLRELIDPTDENQEYDIIYVNWSNGTDDMAENALVLEEVINWVNSVKQVTEENILEENVLLDQSMRGVIGRYTLATMEASASARL